MGIQQLDERSASRFPIPFLGSRRLLSGISGSSSIRMERLVEGIQDAEKIRILRKEFAENGEVAKLKKLNQTVSGFMPEKLNGQNASQMVRNGRKLLSTF